eukprot:gene6214-10220_t
MFKFLRNQRKLLQTCKKFYNQEVSEKLQKIDAKNEFKIENEKKFFWNISKGSFPKESTDILLAPLNETDVEVKPDGIIYLPEIKYRRILNNAFQPGGWGLMQRGPHVLEDQFLSQEFALFCLGQFVSQSFGEQVFNETQFSHRSVATALEGAKSNALMRCCKDLGIASELWDPNYIIQWLEKHTVKVWCEHQVNKKKKLLTRRKDRPAFEYPWKEVGFEKARVIQPVFEDELPNEYLQESVVDSSDLNQNIAQETSDFQEESTASFQENVVQQEELETPPTNSMDEAKAKIQQSDDDVNMFESLEFMNPSTPTYESENKKQVPNSSNSGFNIEGNVKNGKMFLIKKVLKAISNGYQQEPIHHTCYKQEKMH